MVWLISLAVKPKLIASVIPRAYVTPTATKVGLNERPAIPSGSVSEVIGISPMLSDFKVNATFPNSPKLPATPAYVMLMSAIYDRLENIPSALADKRPTPAGFQ